MIGMAVLSNYCQFPHQIELNFSFLFSFFQMKSEKCSIYILYVSALCLNMNDEEKRLP